MSKRMADVPERVILMLKALTWAILDELSANDPADILGNPTLLDKQKLATKATLMIRELDEERAKPMSAATRRSHALAAELIAIYKKRPKKVYKKRQKGDTA